MGPERKRAPGIEVEFAVFIDDQPPQEGRVGADEAEGREHGPAVAQHEGDRRGGEDEVGAHGEHPDRIDGGADVGERDGEKPEGLRFFPLGQEQDINRPKQQQQPLEEGAMDDSQRIGIIGRVDRDVETGQAGGHEGAPEKDQMGLLALEALAQGGDEDADQSHDRELAEGA